MSDIKYLDTLHSSLSFQPMIRMYVCYIYQVSVHKKVLLEVDYLLLCKTFIYFIGTFCLQLPC